jgi:hypothetical protein
MQPIKSNETSHLGESADSGDRIRDFWARHGGPASRRAEAGEIVAGLSGWSEVYAADGYVMRCEWSRVGGLQEMQYIEKPPRQTQ